MCLCLVVVGINGIVCIEWNGDIYFDVVVCFLVFLLIVIGIGGDFYDIDDW